MIKKSKLVRPETIPGRAKYPAVDAHNHLWDKNTVPELLNTLDKAGIVLYCDLTGNVDIRFAEGGYTIQTAELTDFLAHAGEKYPGRFYCFTMASFARDASQPLFSDVNSFVSDCLETLEKDHQMGAKGLKVLKEWGLRHRNAVGELIHLDDDAFDPIWEKAGALGMPVLMHQSDPSGFFDPATPENEHYDTLTKYPSWSFADRRFPRKAELLMRRDRVIRRHPGTLFILPHVANHAENLASVSALLEEHPNVFIDFSARLDELGRQPYTSREFFIQYQDRIIFGTDMPGSIDSSLDMYRCYFRFLETYDEAFYAPDYDGTFGRARWPIHGIGLPDEVLEKIYYKNILRIIPSLNELFHKP